MDYPYALDMILKGAIDVTPLLTHDIPFEDIQKGFEMASNREDGAIKIVLSF
jgi:alcohol dehydrogenase